MIRAGLMLTVAFALVLWPKAAYGQRLEQERRISNDRARS